MSTRNGTAHAPMSPDEIDGALGAPARDENPNPQPPPELRYERGDDGGGQQHKPRISVVEGGDQEEEPKALALIDHQTHGEVDIQVATAQRYPRSIAAFRQEATELATIDEDTAGACMYAVPRKDKNGKTKFIEGPSIRFAEIVAASWGHLRTASRLVEEADEYVVVQGMAWDCQKNLARSSETRRSIMSIGGKRYSADMVTMTINAAASIAVRNAIFAVVPRPYWHAILNAAMVVADGKGQSIESRRANMLEAFRRIGVTPEQLFKVLDVNGAEDVTAELLATARGLMTAIKEGTATIEGTFGPDTTATAQKAADLTDRARNLGKTTRPT